MNHSKISKPIPISQATILGFNPILDSYTLQPSTPLVYNNLIYIRTSKRMVCCRKLLSYLLESFVKYTIVQVGLSYFIQELKDKQTSNYPKGYLSNFYCTQYCTNKGQRKVILNHDLNPFFVSYTLQYLAISFVISSTICRLKFVLLQPLVH